MSVTGSMRRRDGIGEAVAPARVASCVRGDYFDRVGNDDPGSSRFGFKSRLT